VVTYPNVRFPAARFSTPARLSISASQSLYSISTSPLAYISSLAATSRFLFAAPALFNELNTFCATPLVMFGMNKNVSAKGDAVSWSFFVNGPP
jgi:hypothetical protein